MNFKYEYICVLILLSQKHDNTQKRCQRQEFLSLARCERELDIHYVVNRTHLNEVIRFEYNFIMN
jgi:hypothetical protein